jgi:hypothetical protein
MSYLRLSIHSVSPAERGVRRRFVSAPCLIAGHDAFGQGILVEVGASLPQRQGKRPMSTQMSERCFAQVNCSSRLFMRPIVWHAMTSGPYAVRAWSISSSRRTGCSVGAGRPLGPSRSRTGHRR